MFVRKVTVPVVQPFDFQLSLAFLRGFSPMMGEQKLEANALVKSWIVEKQAITVTMTGATDGIACTLASPEAIDSSREHVVCHHVAAFLSAEDDLAEFYAIASRDASFAPVARRLRGLHHPRFATPFEAACWGVINQRIRLSQARKLKAAISARWGVKGCDAFPEAKTLARAHESELLKVLRSERKARAVWSVAQAFSKVSTSWLEEASLGDVEAWLRRIYGVGDFTTGFVLYRGLGRAVLPSHASFTIRSPKLLAAAKQTYGTTCTSTTLRKKALGYGPWVGLWSLYLWAATFALDRVS
jgi:DNA-3-methyladenine glycosylase II